MVRYIGLYVTYCYAFFFKPSDGIYILFPASCCNNYNVEAIESELAGYRISDAPAGSGNDCCLFHFYLSPSVLLFIVIPSRKTAFPSSA